MISVSVSIDGEELRTKDDIKNVISESTNPRSNYKDHINQFFGSFNGSVGDETIKKTLSSIRGLKNTDEICRRLSQCVDRYNARVQVYLELQEKIKSKEQTIDSLLNEYYVDDKYKDLRPLKPIHIFRENIWIFGVKKPSGKVTYDISPRLMKVQIENIITISSTKIIHMNYTTASENKRENYFYDFNEGVINVAVERHD